MLGGSRSEHRGPDPYDRGALFDGDLEVVAHPHRELGEAVFDGELGEGAEVSAVVVGMPCGRRHRHQPDHVDLRRQLPDAGDDLTALLDDLVVNTCLDVIVRETAGRGGPIVTSGGGLSLLAYGTTGEALEFARALRARAADNGIPVRIGIDEGPVLLFEAPDGSKTIAGDPINVASKIAEDAGLAGRIGVTTRAATQLGGAPAGEPFQVTVSGVLLTGFSL